MGFWEYAVRTAISVPDFGKNLSRDGRRLFAKVNEMARHQNPIRLGVVLYIVRIGSSIWEAVVGIFLSPWGARIQAMIDVVPDEHLSAAVPDRALRSEANVGPVVVER